MGKKLFFRRAASIAAALSMTSVLACPVMAYDYTQSLAEHQLNLDGSTQKATLMGSAETIDQYEFEMPSDGTVTIKMVCYGYGGKATGMDYSLKSADYLTTYQFSSVYTGSDIDPEVVTLQAALGKGNYVLRIDDKTSAWSTENVTYSVSASFTAADSHNETEPNDSIAQAMTLPANQKVSGFIWKDDPEDYYKMVIDHDASVDITTKNNLSYGSAFVLDEDGEYVTNCLWAGHSFTRTTDLKAGTYYIQATVSDYSLQPYGSYSVQWKYTDDSETENDSDTVVMYRLYNPNSGEHFYTGNETEKNHLVSLGWRDEGVGWVAPISSSTPVYRLYNPNGAEHHYTQSTSERNMLVQIGWKNEGIGWYSDDDKTVPVYRQFNPNELSNNHNYTADVNEKNNLIKAGWRDENIGWYAVARK